MFIYRIFGMKHKLTAEIFYDIGILFEELNDF